MPERIAYAREPRKLPVVLSADEVVRFLEAVPSLKSRTALTTAYAAGLRVSEVVRPEGRRHRQRADGDPGRAGQGRQGPLRHAVAAAAADSAHLLAARPAEATGCFPAATTSVRSIQRPARRLPLSLRGGGLEQAGDGAHAAPQLRHPSAGERHRHPHHPGAARPRQPRRARRATPRSPPRRSATRRARSTGSAWRSCRPAERAPWRRLWRWRISSAATAKRSDRRMPVISGASSAAS